jgi:hypothetical protein
MPDDDEHTVVAVLEERFKNLREAHRETMSEMRSVKAIVYEDRGRISALESTRATWLNADAKGNTGLSRAIQDELRAHEEARSVSWREWGGWAIGLLGFLLAVYAVTKGG